jgi:hypothetical protein
MRYIKEFVTKLFGLIIIITIVMVGVWYYTGWNDERKAKQEKAIEYIYITTDQICKQYERNGKLFEDYYEGKYIRTSGIIRKISDSWGKPVVYIKSSCDITFFLDKGQTQNIYKYKIGDLIHLQGSYSFSFLDGLCFDNGKIYK